MLGEKGSATDNELRLILCLGDVSCFEHQLNVFAIKQILFLNTCENRQQLIPDRRHVANYDSE